MATLTEVKAAQPAWFRRGNTRFFNDVSYRVLHGTASHKPFLVRATYGWTDMFGGPKWLHYRINPLDPETLKIQTLVDERFGGMEAVKYWLKDN